MSLCSASVGAGELHVDTSADAGCFPYLSAMPTSLRCSVPLSRTLHVTFLSRDVHPAEIGWPNRCPPDTVRRTAPEIPVGSVLPIREYDLLTVQTYYGLFRECAFYALAQRVVYRDADLVVVDDITPLVEMDLRGRSVAAAVDCFSQFG